MIGAIGFDLGETLLTYAGTPLNWRDLYEPALRSAAKQANIDVTADRLRSAAAILRRYNTRLVPRDNEVTAGQIFTEILVDWNEQRVTADRFAAAFFDFFQQRAVPYPDSAPALDQLRGRGFRVGVLTDVPYGMPRSLVDEDLKNAGLLARIDWVLASTDVGLRKPRPEGFAALAERLGVKASEMLYVGNEPKDIAGANAAGAISVLIDRENRHPELGQRYTIRSLGELAKIAESENR